MKLIIVMAHYLNSYFTNYKVLDLKQRVSRIKLSFVFFEVFITEEVEE